MGVKRGRAREVDQVSHFMEQCKYVIGGGDASIAAAFKSAVTVNEDTDQQHG